MSCRRQSSGRISESPISPLRRNELTAFDLSNSGASARSRNIRRAIPAFSSIALRKGEASPSTSGRSFSHFHMPPPATAATAAARKPRREPRWIPASVLRSNRCDVLFIRNLVALPPPSPENLLPHVLCAAIVPPPPDNHRNRYYKKTQTR